MHTTHTSFPSLFNARHARDASHTHTRSRSRQDSAESPPQSRATSPLRAIFDRWPALHRAHSREELFVAVDPFRARYTFSLTRCFHRIPPSSSNPSTVGSISIFTDVDVECDDACCFPVHTRPARMFVTDTLPRQMYLHMLMRLPSLYFTRVARIFEDAEVSRPEVQRMIDACFPRDVGATRGHGHGHALPFPEEWNPPTVSPALVRFRHSWEAFIDSLIREWKTLNVVSALLLSAILTMFQIPDAANDPLTRTAALLSLVCALMSLSYGCIYIVRFGTMRSMIRASRWAEEAQKTKTSILWNVWVLLAAPAVWLAWSMVAFVVSILSFVWRTGSTGDPSSDDPGENPRILSQRQALGPRVAITAVLALGLVYFAMIVMTFRSYGSGRWSRRATRRRADGDVESGEGSAPGEARVQREGEETRGRRRERQRGKSVLGLGLSGTGAPAKSPMGQNGDAAGNGKTEAGVTVDVEKVEEGSGEDEKGRASGSVSPLGI
ncbi:hypothetical protein EWM64_g7176 [Hericium alpestre]|uniref:Uncharacterized protein n=1 Tax=Hericium alpestre TaxID=135208 RepID=A0A4Y9ZS07_9AGAM|nr:hypothetical protein EWM64_g7176 [Hericium alpestre]